MDNVIKEYSELIELAKVKYNVSLVANFNQLALSSIFRKSNLNFNDFENVEYINQNASIYINNENIRVLCCNFAFFPTISRYMIGYNMSHGTLFVEDNVIYNEALSVLLPFDESQKTEIITAIENIQIEQKDWQDFNTNVRPKLKELGEKFEVGEFIYYHFLECMPPIYCNDGFCCGEPYTHKNNKAVYYKLTKVGDKYYIELNFSD